ncbi:Ribosome Assembly protein [Phaffia rhodozyma]|uniref:Glutamate-rich WD repeat-containing protein 1 n=1 Tax=Phaffia rhodozyma TaxID=264483 RepID=A0A0F7SII3_PHARH|nr:Ribosome Assembly protein [Phaffia rhodozyma]
MVKANKRRSSPGPISEQTNKSVALGEGSAPVRSTGEDGTNEEDEMGEFEDNFDDGEESAEEIIRDDESESDESENGETMHVDQAVEDEDPVEPELETYLRSSRPLEKDEVLEPDQSVYEMLHRMNVQWPCLSFDVLRDSLGDERRKFPHTAYVVTGTQAESENSNELLVMKMGGMHRTQFDDDLSDAGSEADSDVDDDAYLEYRSIPHVGTVNRVRAQPIASTSALPPVNVPYHTASWSETGKVHIWDIRPLIESLDVPGYVMDRSVVDKPVYTINNHGRAEGFALDWAGGESEGLRLLTGDIHSKIYLTTSNQSGFTTSNQAFTSHTSSVEDLQWSPTERTVFASCSADRSIRVWDVRQKGRRSVVGLDEAHESDVNVISWNKGTSYLLVSGGDEGGLKVWDLRNFKGASGPTPSPVASFNWHTSPITSVAWHPTETSTFAAAAAEGTVTLWDLSVEQDEDEEGQKTEDGLDVPAQLLFEHHQEDCKEVAFLPQVPGAVVSTGSGGFNCWKTISV